MQYLLLIYDAETVWETMPEDQRNAMFAEYGTFSENRTSVMLLPRLANMRARLKASNSSPGLPNVASPEKSVALTRKPVPGVEKVAPRIRPAKTPPARGSRALQAPGARTEQAAR